jgi:hypothetical protein
MLVSFTTYLKEVETAFSRLREQIGGNVTIHDPSVRHPFLSLVETLEARGEFSALGREMAEEFSNDEFPKHFTGFWENEAKTFFRMARIYEYAFVKDALPLADVRELFEKEFRQTTKLQTTLAPIEFVEFEQKAMSFGDFSIQRFTKDELDTLLKQEVCKVFYPWAVVDTEKLSDYWFLVTTEETPATFWGKLSWNDAVEPRYSSFVGKTKDAFRALILFKWTEKFFADDPNMLIRKLERQQGFSSIYPEIPFTLRIFDTLRNVPPSAPDLNKLATEPIMDGRGEEVGERPIRAFDLFRDEQEYFCKFIKDIEAAVGAITARQEWRFMNTALNFLEKGFTDGGMEQLLWHITTLEALLGEKIESGLTTLLKNRVGQILGRTDAEKRVVRKNFENLYSLRSDYIHGNVKFSDRKVLHAELAQAREFARLITLWMVSYLRHVLSEASKGNNVLPSREDLLAVLDMDEASRKSVGNVISQLPNEFPRLPSLDKR